MKNTIVCVLLMALLFCGCQSDHSPSQIAIKDLGIPTIEQYPDDTVSRCPWDMTVWNNKLYVGAGDYGANTGPVDCMTYDCQMGQWENSGTVLEESIARFCSVDGTLMIPGIDSTVDGHLLGEYYALQDGQWQMKRTITGGIHCFDLVSFEDKLFAGLGVTQGEYPVADSEDNGETFTQVPFYQNGQPVATAKDAIRVYDLFVLNQTLYAVYISENNESGKPHDFECSVYRYEDERFVYESDWNPCYETVGATQIPFAAKEVFHNRLFVATGYLYEADDSFAFEKISLENGIVLDLLQKDGILYALSNTSREDGTVDISVWRTQTGEIFEQVLCFNYPTPALSFALQGETYYIGIGNMNLQHDANGTVLAVTP